MAIGEILQYIHQMYEHQMGVHSNFQIAVNNGPMFQPVPMKVPNRCTAARCSP